MAEDFVLADDAAVLVLLPDDVVLPGVQFKTNHYSLQRWMSRVAVKSNAEKLDLAQLSECFNVIFSLFLTLKDI